jgi:hypothetical protein
MRIKEKSGDFLMILESLREYMYKFYPERRDEDPLPLEFWTLDDDMYYEYMNYLGLKVAIHFADNMSEILTQLPEAMHILYPISLLDDDYEFNGWTALTNAGSEQLPLVIAAYKRIGLTVEAEALSAALKSCLASPDDTEAAESAYKEFDSPYADDELRREAVIEFMRKNEYLWESYI